MQGSAKLEIAVIAVSASAVGGLAAYGIQRQNKIDDAMEQQGLAVTELSQDDEFAPTRAVLRGALQEHTGISLSFGRRYDGKYGMRFANEEKPGAGCKTIENIDVRETCDHIRAEHGQQIPEARLYAIFKEHGLTTPEMDHQRDLRAIRGALLSPWGRCSALPLRLQDLCEAVRQELN